MNVREIVDALVPNGAMHEKLFHLLVETAKEYEAELTAMQFNGEGVQRIGLVEMDTPRDVMVKGLVECLELHEEDRK
jgi:hypothetical protein